MNHKGTKKPSAEDAVDRAAHSIRQIKVSAGFLRKLGEDFTANLDIMENSFRNLIITNNSEEIRKLYARTARLRELKNMMELGSYQIQIDREMGEAWRRLP